MFTYLLFDSSQSGGRNGEDWGAGRGVIYAPALNYAWWICCRVLWSSRLITFKSRVRQPLLKMEIGFYRLVNSAGSSEDCITEEEKTVDRERGGEARVRKIIRFQRPDSCECYIKAMIKA